MKDLKEIGPITWSEILETWRQQEGVRPEWIEHAHKRGYPDWLSWRQEYWKEIQLDNLNWALYEVPDPAELFSACHIGPFSSWKKYYEGDAPTLTDLVQHPDVIQNDKIQGCLEAMTSGKLPETTLILLQVRDKLVVFEGTHRACALAIAQRDELEVQTKVRVVIADLDPEIYARYVNPSLEGAE